jgi:GPH family glycoside/pentoside/hexuronide:cation symporter
VSEPAAQLEVPLPELPSEASEVSLRSLLCYAGPVFGLSTTLFFVQFYFLKFAADVLLVAPALVGALFALARAWDAISDPLVGSWSDRTRSRLGRRRGWMFAGIPVIAVAFWMTWVPPIALEGRALEIWIAAGLLLYFTGFTLFFVPHQSLGAELSTRYHERTRIFGARQASFILGIFLAFGAIQYVTLAEDQRAAARNVVLIVVPIACLLLLIPPVFLRERVEYQGRGGGMVWGSFRDVLRSPHAAKLLLVQFVDSLGLGVVGVIAPFMAEYIIKRPDLIGVLPAFLVIPQIASIPLWVRLSRRFGKKQVWIVSMVGVGLSFGGNIFVGENTVVLISVLLVFTGFFSGCGGAVAPSLLADVIDFDEYETGERKEGVYSAALGFAFKCGAALIVIIAGFALQWAGFVPNAEQTATVRWTILVMYALVPLFMFLLGAAVFLRFGLDEREHARIRGVLDLRNSGAGS